MENRPDLRLDLNENRCLLFFVPFLCFILLPSIFISHIADVSPIRLFAIHLIIPEDGLIN